VLRRAILDVKRVDSWLLNKTRLFRFRRVDQGDYVGTTHREESVVSRARERTCCPKGTTTASWDLSKDEQPADSPSQVLRRKPPLCPMEKSSGLKATTEAMENVTWAAQAENVKQDAVSMNCLSSSAIVGSDLMDVDLTLPNELLLMIMDVLIERQDKRSLITNNCQTHGSARPFDMVARQRWIGMRPRRRLWRLLG